MISIANSEVHAPPPSLLARAQAGDARAFCEMCSEYQARLIGHAITLCRDPAAAEDLAQETFIEAWRNLRKYRAESRFYTWLCAILLNRYRNLIRRKRPFPFSFLPIKERTAAEEVWRSAVDTADMPDQWADRNERAILVAAMLKRLSPPHRDVIFLRFFVDDSLESIATATRCPVGTVKSRLYYALEELRGMAELKELLKEKCL